MARWQQAPAKLFHELLALGNKTRTGLATNGLASRLAETFDRPVDAEDVAAHEHATLLTRIVESSDDAIIGETLDGTILSWNHGAERLYGYTPDEVIGRPISILVPRKKHDEVPTILDRIGRGESISRYETSRRRKDGKNIDVSLTISPVRSPDGRIIAAASIARDVTEQKRTTKALRFLARASAVLGQTLDYKTTLSRVAGLVVPELADWCAIDLLDVNGDLEQVALVHADPLKVDPGSKKNGRLRHSNSRIDRGAMHVARTGESEVYSRLTDSLLGDIAWNDEHGNILISLDVQSAALIPLVARGRTLGVMTLATTSRGRMYTDSDLPFIEELARRCALAVDNARLYRDAQREIAERNRITEGLRESENRYRAVVSTVMDGIVTIDAAGTIIFANPAVERLFGYAPSDLIGQNVKILMPAPDALRHDTYLARYLETGHAKIIGIGREVTAKRNDGSTFPINLSIGEFSQDGHRFFTGVIQDITQRKRAEENLKALNETLERRVEQRSGFVKLLRDVAVIANEAPTADEAFRLVLECVCAYNGWLVGHVFAVGECDNPVIVDSGIWAPGPPRRLNRLVARSRDTTLQSGEDIVGRVVESGKPVWIAELSKCDLLVRARLGKSTFIKSLIAVPVWVGSRVAAVLEFFSADEVSVDEELFEVMRQIGVQVGRVVERKQWVKQVADAVWEEHAKVGQTLHDDLGQHMTGIGLLAESIHRTLRAENSPAKKTAADLVKSAREARQQISALIKGIRPVEVDAEGLMVALKELSASTVRLSGIRCTFKCNGTVRVENNKVATHLFQIAREAVTNAVRHAKANRIAVQLSISRGRLILRVRDNGVGICERAHGMGLRIMQHRAGLIGAELDVGTGRQGGTVIVCTLKPNGNHVR